MERPLTLWAPRRMPCRPFSIHDLTDVFLFNSENPLLFSNLVQESTPAESGLVASGSVCVSVMRVCALYTFVVSFHGIFVYDSSKIHTSRNTCMHVPVPYVFGHVFTVRLLIRWSRAHTAL